MITIFVAILIFIVGISGGAWPIIFGDKSRTRRYLIDGEALARGIFLGAAIIHMLPDAASHFTDVVGDVDYPYMFVIALLTVWLLSLLKQVGFRICQDHASQIPHQHWQPYLLMLVLSVHSFIVGGALGISDNVTSVLVLTLAVVAHKGAAGFALSTNMRRCSLPKQHIWPLITIFALMTPLGIFVGHGMSTYLAGHDGELVLAIFSAVAAGTFLYVAMDEALSNDVAQTSVTSTCYFGAGIIIMALVALVL